MQTDTAQILHPPLSQISQVILLNLYFPGVCSAGWREWSEEGKRTLRSNMILMEIELWTRYITSKLQKSSCGLLKLNIQTFVDTLKFSLCLSCYLPTCSWSPRWVLKMNALFLKHFDTTEIIISEKLMRKLIIMSSELNMEETKYQVTTYWVSSLLNHPPDGWFEVTQEACSRSENKQRTRDVESGNSYPSVSLDKK